MKKNNILICYLCALFLFTGCGSRQESLQTRANISHTDKTNRNVEENGDSLTVITENEDKGYTSEPDENIIQEQESKNNTAKSRAKYLADALSAMDGVSRANIVITGNTAIVGITLETEMDDGRLITLKRDIEKEVKLLDNEIDHVAVTAAPDLVSRIIDMQEDKPEKGIESDALFRLVPTI